MHWFRIEFLKGSVVYFLSEVNAHAVSRANPLHQTEGQSVTREPSLRNL
jgi:hypothetical protein